MTITKEQIARLRELEKAATKGPWGYEDGELYAGDESLPVIRYDLDLIVKSRNLLPALLDEVERLQEVEHKLSCVLVHGTGNALSKPEVSLDAMYRAIDDHTEELVNDAENLASQSCHQYGARVFDAVMKVCGYSDGVSVDAFHYLESQRARILGGGE
jgi:hypothetical protein